MIKLEIVNREIALHICDLNGETFHPVISLADAEYLTGLLDHVLERQAARKTTSQLKAQDANVNLEGGLPCGAHYRRR